MFTTAYETRAEATHLTLKKALEEKLQTFEGGELDGVQFVTNADMLDVFALPLPEPNERAAEVSTPARISVLGLCPLCGQGSYLAVHLTPVLTIETTGRTLKLQAKTKGVNHNCGQTTLDAQVSGQEDFGLGDIVRPGDALTNDERDEGIGGDPEGWEPSADDDITDDGGDLLPE